MMRELDIRFRILRNGADFGELYALDGSSPTLRMSETGEIKMSLSGDFVLPDEIDWLSDEIRPELWIDGVRHPLGIYLPATVQEKITNEARGVSVEAYDRCWIVRDTYLEDPLYLAAGTQYLTAIENLLVASGISTAAITPTAITLPEAREGWEVGTSYLEIVNQLLSEINYKPLWFNNAGLAVLEPVREPSVQNLSHTLDGSNVQSLLLPTMNRQTDIYSAPNVFICVCSNPDKDSAMVATAENVNPQSPLSTVRRGRRICRRVQVENVASQEELEAYAARLCNESLIGGEQITVQTALLPDFGVGDITALNYHGTTGLCLERAWTMVLSPTGGTMTHQLEKVVFNFG